MPHAAHSEAEQLLNFNIQVLDQALALVAAHQAPSAPSYANPVGAHLRHVIEHYWALLRPASAGVVDYDARARDRELEQSPVLARAQLLAIQRELARWSHATLDAPVRVRGQAGLAGDIGFSAQSSIGRELVFIASHAIHHFAVLHQHCKVHGLVLDADFGKAPATVAHERTARRDLVTRSTKDLPCDTLLPSR